MRTRIGSGCLLIGFLLATAGAGEEVEPMTPTLEAFPADTFTPPPSPFAESVPVEAAASPSFSSEQNISGKSVSRGSHHHSSLCKCWHCKLKPCLQASHWGYSEYFQEPPLGAYMNAHIDAQIANGAAARMVLYQYDFLDGAQAKVLNSRGLYQLKKIALLAERNPFPIVLEPSGDQATDTARLAFVVNTLTQISPLASPEQRVVLAEPTAGGLGGREATIIHENMLRSTRSRGANVLTGTGGLSTGSGTGSNAGSGISGAVYGAGS